MDEKQAAVARTCLAGAETDTMTFPQIVGSLMEAGFESYTVDFRRATATYYLPEGDSIVLSARPHETRIADRLDAGAVQAAIREAQALVPGYTYGGFCEKIMAVGCAFYVVSFSGGRAVYFGRTAETHVEHFPQ